MTAQIPEKLNYKGQQFRMCTHPLDNYEGCRLKFAHNCTALRRGYVGTWEIIDDRLYLVALAGSFENGSKVTLGAVFPDYHDRIFAHWYSGTMQIQQGKLLQYVHLGYFSVYERDMFFEMVKGVVKQTYTKNNHVPESEEATNVQEVGAKTVSTSIQN